MSVPIVYDSEDYTAPEYVQRVQASRDAAALKVHDFTEWKNVYDLDDSDLD